MLSNATIECYLSACSSRFHVKIGKSKVHQHKSKASNDVDRNDCTLPGYKTFGQGVSLWCDDTQHKTRVVPVSPTERWYSHFWGPIFMHQVAAMMGVATENQAWPNQCQQSI